MMTEISAQDVSSQLNDMVQIIRLPEKNRTETVCKLALLVFSAGVGFTIAFPATIPDWSKMEYVVTNIGVIFSYGVIGTWGLFMSGYYAGAALACNTKKKKSYCYSAAKVQQVLISIASGFFAQLPIFEIAKKFNGLNWAIATQIGGMWVPAYSQYALIDAMGEQAALSPLCALSLDSRHRAMIAGKMRTIFSNNLKHTRLQSEEDKALLFANWSEKVFAPQQKQRVEALYQDLAKLSKELSTKPKLNSCCSLVTKKIIQISSTGLTAFYFLQNILLAKEVWSGNIPDPDEDTAIGTLSVLPLAYYVLKGAWVSSGHLCDLIGDAFKCKREENFQETYHRKLSRLLYLAGMAMACLPQWQTGNIAGKYYDPQTPFGMTFLVSNVLATTQFIYITMKEMIDVILEEIVDHGYANQMILRARLLEMDLKKCIDDLQHKPLEELYRLTQGLSNELKEHILKDIDENELKELLPTLVNDKVTTFNGGL